MLYDPKWEKTTETKADPFTLEGLIAWLEKQPPAQRYDYSCNGHCLLAQYFTAHGYSDINLGTRNFHYGPLSARGTASFPPQFNNVAVDSPRNFGAALQRARKALTA